MAIEGSGHREAWLTNIRCPLNLQGLVESKPFRQVSDHLDNGIFQLNVHCRGHLETEAQHVGQVVQGGFVVNASAWGRGRGHGSGQRKSTLDVLGI